MNAKEFDPAADFPITGLSYIGNPQPNTAMFAGKKLEHFLPRLASVQNAVIFVSNDMDIPTAATRQNVFVRCKNPVLPYARVAQHFWRAWRGKNDMRKYKTVDGVSIGENVQVGSRVLLQPGVVVGHDVTIGDDCVLLAGCKVFHAQLGSGCTMAENAVLGAEAFFNYRDEAGKWRRMPSMGQVLLGDGVGVGSGTCICRSSADTTRIGHHTQIDTGVYIAHDVQCGKNVTMTSGVQIGGYSVIGDDVYLGMNCTVRNRVTVGQGATVGMGGVVAQDVPPNATVVGVPARQKT